MIGNFDACFARTEQWEGWHVFTDDPHDPGGATWCGLTQRAYNAWRAMHGKPIQPVRRATDEEIKQIFREEYWNVVRGDELPAGVDFEVFDTAINMGPAVAIRILQDACNHFASNHLIVDGWIGPQTLAAVQHSNAEELIQSIAARRLLHWMRLPTWPRFGRGWDNRLNSAVAQSLEMWRKANESAEKVENTDTQPDDRKSV